MNEFNEKDQTTGEDSANSSRENPAPGSFGGEQPGHTSDRWSSGGQPPAPERPAPPPEHPPYNPGQGYQRPPYSPRYSQNSYPPQPPATRQDNGYPTNQGQQGYHQYNANSGWQQPPPNQEKYEWKMEDYDKLDLKRDKKKKNRGLIVFSVALVSVLSICLVCLAGYGIYSATYGDTYVGDEVEQSSQEGVDGVTSSDDTQMEIVGKPAVGSGTATVVPEGVMTTPQIAKAVLPSVVGVIKYDSNQFYAIDGLGSGIIMNSEGYIITNAHVVEGGGAFKVQLHDGTLYDAQLIGADNVTDLAVIKVNADGLEPAIFGDSDDIEVGETVVAIGNPAGLELAGSVTKGIVSALNREVRTTNYFMNYIQIDAAINPGNSGGALVNEFGQVIGINSSKIVAAEYEGIGFAIPISGAKPVIDDIIGNGKVTGRVMLGITSREVDSESARNFGLERGLQIQSVDDNSDLSRNGVLQGDILTHIDGERVYGYSDVRKILDTHTVGDSVTLTFYRRLGNKETTFEVTTRLVESN